MKSSKDNPKVIKAKKEIDPEDYVPETAFARIRAFLFFNRTAMREIPYMDDLEGESMMLYLIPLILMTISAFLSTFFLPSNILSIIDPITYIIVPLEALILELFSILFFIIVLLISMRKLIPGFPKESHASPKMVIVAFSYVYLTKIILIIGNAIFLFYQYTPFALTAFTIFTLSLYIFSPYLVIVASYTTKSLTGAPLVSSLLVGFGLYFAILLPNVLRRVFLF